MILSWISISAEVYLGVYLTEYDPELDFKEEFPDYGLKVYQVIKDSPAAEAGLQDGDIILQVGDKKLDNIDELEEILAKYQAGDSLTFIYLREGKTLKTKVKLDEKIQTDKTNIEERIEDLLDRSRTYIFRIESQEDNVIGVEIAPLQENQENKGVEINKVLTNSPAARADLQKGDLIIKVQGKEVNSPSDLVNAIQKAKVESFITLDIKRQNELIQAQVQVVKRKSIFE